MNGFTTAAQPTAASQSSSAATDTEMWSEVGKRQPHRVGRAVLFVLVVVATVTAVDEVRLVSKVLRIEADLQVFGQRVAGAEIDEGLGVDMAVVSLVVDSSQFIEVRRL